MKVDVLLFAAAREAAGAARLSLDLPAGATVRQLYAYLAEQYHALAPVLPSCRAAVDETFAISTTALSDGSVVAILPPVSGG